MSFDACCTCGLPWCAWNNLSQGCFLIKTADAWLIFLNQFPVWFSFPLHREAETHTSLCFYIIALANRALVNLSSRWGAWKNRPLLRKFSRQLSGSLFPPSVTALKWCSPPLFLPRDKHHHMDESTRGVKWLHLEAVWTVAGDLLQHLYFLQPGPHIFLLVLTKQTSGLVCMVSKCRGQMRPTLVLKRGPAMERGSLNTNT